MNYFIFVLDKNFKKMYKLTGFIFIILISYAECLIGYDCGSRTLNVTTLSLIDIGDCDLPIPEVNITDQYVQLLQVNEFSEVTVYQCKIVIDRVVEHCGMLSYNSIVQGGLAEYIRDIDRESCYDMFNTRKYIIDYNKVIDGLRINETIVRSVTLAGSVKNSGGCDGASYSDPYGSWDDVIVIDKIKISLFQQTARVNLATDKIYLSSGTTCKLTDNMCIDSENGYSFWKSLPHNKCGFQQYGLLYDGIAEKIREDGNTLRHTVYKMQSNDISFALSATHEDYVCGYKIVRTEHPKLIIFETIKGQSFAMFDQIKPSNLDLFAYMNSKFVYVEKHIRSQMKQMFYNIIVQQCKIEQEGIKNALAIATNAPDQFAYNLMKGPGYMAMTAGEVTHIIKCIPVEVKIKHDEVCYSELQVEHKNQTFYMTPRTHVLKTRGTVISCNPVLAPEYRVDQTWYKILHKPIAVKDPVKIQPQTKMSWKYENPEFLATSGIYTEKDLASIRDTIMFPVERASVLNDFAREIHGVPTQGRETTIMRLLNEETFEKIVDSYWSRTWQKFITFGTISAGIITILMIFQFLKHLAEIVINGVALHRIYGFSYHLIGAIWNSLAHLLISLGTPPNTKEDKQQDTESVELMPPKYKNDDHKPGTSHSITIEEPKGMYPTVDPTKGYFALEK